MTRTSCDIDKEQNKRYCSKLQAVQQGQEKEKEQEEEEALSDVDTRVLREMLQESKLDLETEEDVRKLLDRGTKKKATTTTPESDISDSEFESKILQKLSDTKLWKALSAKTSDIVESAKLWVSNKVERDLKTLAALGIFAWDRVVRDVARALPASATSRFDKQRQLMLTNSSSFQQVDEAQRTTSNTDSLRKELNRPSDEIKSVSQDLWDILSGKTTDVKGSDRRGLRTVAKAGTANIADRQRRAYQQTRKKREQETVVKGVQKIPGGIVDVTYELQRELRAETSTAGYKTKPIRKAIKAGVEGTGNYLKGIKDAARLAAAERRAKRLSAVGADPNVAESGFVQEISSQNDAPETAKSPWETTSVSATKGNGSISSETTEDPVQIYRTELLLQLRIERKALLERLLACIQEPDKTWLKSELVANEARTLSQESLREIATLIILLKDELTKTMKNYDEQSLESVLEQLKFDVRMLQEARDSVVSSISSPIGNTLYGILVGEYDEEVSENNETPVLLRLNEIETLLENPPLPESTGQFWQETTVADPVKSPTESETMVQEFVDVLAEPVVVESKSTAFVDVEHESTISGDREKVVPTAALIPELVTDDDFEEAVGVRKAAQGRANYDNEGDDDDDDEEDEKPPLFVAVILRTLDVAFFVMEKVFTVAIPRTVTFVSTAAQRVDEVNQGGKGKKGWEKIRNTADPKGRY